MFYLFTGTPFICDVALIRPSVRTGAPSPSGKALIARQVFMDSILIPSPAFAGVFFWNGGVQNAGEIPAVSPCRLRQAFLPPAGILWLKTA